MKKICNIDYIHRPDFAPTKDILDAYKKREITWGQYELDYKKLLKQRSVENEIDNIELNKACLLCSEPTAEKCHRRLLAEYCKKNIEGITIKHL